MEVLFLKKKIQCGPHVPSSICITNFASLGTGLSPPCAGSFAGIVQKAWPIEPDVRGTVDILDFTLIDDYGAWIKSCATDSNANTDVIAEGNRIVGFSGSGSSGTGAQDARLYFSGINSIEVKVEEVKRIPCKLTEQCCLNSNASGM